MFSGVLKVLWLTLNAVPKPSLIMLQIPGLFNGLWCVADSNKSHVLWRDNYFREEKNKDDSSLLGPQGPTELTPDSFRDLGHPSMLTRLGSFDF